MISSVVKSLQMIIGDSKWKTSFQGGIMKISTKVTLLTLLVMFLGFFCLWMQVNGTLNILKKSSVVDLTVLYSSGEVDTPVRIRVA